MSIELIEGVIQKDFLRYLNLKHKQISDRTLRQYISDINYYVDNYINTSILIDRFDNFFPYKIVDDFLNKRKSSTARATLMNFINCLREHGRLEDSKYIEITELLKTLKKTSLEKQMEFLNHDQLLFLLSERINYKIKDQETRFVLPMLLSLSYHLVFEQDHLIKLKWSDIHLEKKRIGNLRRDTDDKVIEWICIDDHVCEQLFSYRSVAQNTNNDDPVLFFKGKTLTNTAINSLLGILKRKENNNVLKTTVDIQKINRSRILKDLLNTNGKSAIDFIKIIGLNRNTQLAHALEEYLLYDFSKM